jgi:hypothetical protein
VHLVCIEDAVGLSIFVLVSPNHGVHFDDTEDTMGNDFFLFMSHVSSMFLALNDVFSYAGYL